MVGALGRLFQRVGAALAKERSPSVTLNVRLGRAVRCVPFLLDRTNDGIVTKLKKKKHYQLLHRQSRCINRAF